jgi:sulfite dehydrogenase (quinone) subunit SoeC
MKPAFSVIFFTASSGAGLGLLFLLVMARLFHSSPPSPQWWTAAGVAAALITLGLVSSTLHLANRKNAWRAVARFKTSWLSREGVFALLLYPVAGLYLFAVWKGLRPLEVLLGLLLMALALAILYCTAMIYACLRTIPRWNTWHTRVAYPVLGLMSGALIMLALIPGSAAPMVAKIAVILLLCGAAVKVLYYLKFADAGTNDKNTTATVNDALNLRQGKVRLLDVGHSHGTFLTNEFGFEVARNNASLIKLAAFFLAFIAPFILINLSLSLAPVCAVLCMIGLFAERWLFFAEAKHVVNLYHGTQRV